MKEATSIRIGQLFDRALVDTYGKSNTERAAKIAEAKANALELCKTQADTTIVECRALEAELNSAIMNMLRLEVANARSNILNSAFFSESRRNEMVTMADRFLNYGP